MDTELYNQLLELRIEIATMKKIPTYVIFHNTSLEEMAEKKPKTIEELLEIKFVTKSKATKYGKKFLELIKDYVR